MSKINNAEADRHRAVDEDLKDASASPAQAIHTLAVEPPKSPLKASVDSKLSALMNLINPNATAAPPLPPYDELVKQINEQQLTDPQALPPLYFADVMDCFRMYFGPSATTFPFFCSRLGVLGYFIVIWGGVFVGYLTQLSLHRTRYNMVLLQMKRRMEKEAAGGPNTIAGIEMNAMSTPTSSTTTSPTGHGGHGGHGKKKFPDDPSDMMPVFMGFAAITELGVDMWPDHWMRDAVFGIILCAQFFACGSYTLLFSENVAGVLGIETHSAVNIGAIAMGVLSLATHPTAKTILAYVNNIFIFGGVAIILFATFAHEKTEEEEAMSLQILPKSITEFAMYAPALLSYIAAQLYTLDVESIVARRAYRMMRGKAPEPSPESPTAMAGAMTPVSQSGLGTFSAAFGGLRADVLKKSIIVVQTMQACYVRAVQYGIVGSIMVLWIFSEVITFVFRDNTNPIIAKSFPEGTIRTVIMYDLMIGLYASGVLEITPISDMLDLIADNYQGFERFGVELLKKNFVKRIFSRVILFALVVLFLWLVPFFEFVAALTGALCSPMIFFLIPTVCELQSEILKAREDKDTKAAMANASLITSLKIVWNRMSWRAQYTAAFSLIVGPFILVFATGIVLNVILVHGGEGLVGG